MIHHRDTQLFKNLQVARSHNLDGILKFTPRDNMVDYAPSPGGANTLTSDQFGYKGFAAHHFEHGRSKAEAKPLVTDLWKSPREPSHGVPHYLGRPRHAGEGQSFQYGSHGGVTNAAQPAPLKGTLLNPKTPVDNTSAELRKFHQQQEEATQDINQYKQEKMVKLQQREEEKKQDLQMLKSYNPWGRPGGGAPRNAGPLHDNKKTKIDDKELFQEHSSPRKDELKEEYGDFHSYFNKPGHGAPIRSESGQLKTQLRGDTSIRFQDTNKGRVVCDQEVRYQAPGDLKQQYHRELEQQVETGRAQSQEQRMMEMKQDLEMLEKYDPYGKPGAGAPNKTRSEMERAPGKVNRANSEEVYDPWGKGAVQPIRNNLGDVRRFKYSEKGTKEPYTHDVMKQPLTEDSTMLDVNSSRGGGGGPLKTESGNVQARLPITMQRDDKGRTTIKERAAHKRPGYLADDPEYSLYDPWGKNGAGAPLRDSTGNIITNVYGKLKDDSSRLSGDPRERQKAKQQYLDELPHGKQLVERDMHQQKMDKNNRDNSAGIDLAALMKQGQVGRPKRDPKTGMLINQHLGTTDVTKGQTQKRSMKNEDSEIYHSELEKEARDRDEMRRLDRMKEKQEENYHQAVMSNFWGKPGAGAPNKLTKKANLDNILYSPRKEANDYYNKNFTGDQRPYNYIRNTVNSMHRNMYEFNTNTSRQPKKDYNLLTPYATNREESL